jgi:hypothetical protein
VRLRSHTARFLDKESFEEFVEAGWFFHVPEEDFAAAEQSKTETLTLTLSL